MSAYQAAKWAVGGFSEVLAKEVGPFGIKVTVLEPGGMQTDWAGSSMRVPPISEPYQPTVGAMARLHNDLGSTSALGDPAKVARVVLEVAGMAEPPLRLILGSEAYAYAMAAARARAEADAAWHHLTAPPTGTTPRPRTAIRSPRRATHDPRGHPLQSVLPWQPGLHAKTRDPADEFSQKPGLGAQAGRCPAPHGGRGVTEQ